ncbi:MAG TPA: hypothetical protein VFK05_36630 [Polyangiaceae bacterium]|nr:hypothetical protein [Polyangiaceae bacterium]
MRVWSKLFGGSNEAPDLARLTPPTRARASTVPLVTDKLSATFHAHDVADGSEGNFLTAVSDGLLKRGQRELVMTLRLAPDADVSEHMRELSRFFLTVWRWAQQRNLVDTGDVTRFGQRGMFGGSGNGVLYVAARPLRGVTMPGRALAAIVVDPAEVETALAHGTYRVLARLGEKSGCFPFPIWSDLARRSVASAREAESALSKLSRIRAHGVHFLVEGKRLRVSVPKLARGVVAHGVGALAPGTPFSLLTEPAENADALLVWYPGQAEPKAIYSENSEGARLTGGCLAVVPGGQQDEIRVMEDGYTLLLSSDTWGSLASALLGERVVSLPMADDATLEIEWLYEQSARGA